MLRNERASQTSRGANRRSFRGIDILVNNASAIHLATTAEVPAKRYDLMMDINVRGTFMCSQACLPFLEKR